MKSSQFIPPFLFMTLSCFTASDLLGKLEIGMQILFSLPYKHDAALLFNVNHYIASAFRSRRQLFIRKLDSLT